MVVEVEPMFFSIKESDTSYLEHKKREELEKMAMGEVMEKLGKMLAETERKSKQKDKEKRAKQQQHILMPGLRKGSNMYLRQRCLVCKYSILLASPIYFLYQCCSKKLY